MPERVTLKITEILPSDTPARLAWPRALANINEITLLDSGPVNLDKLGILISRGIFILMDLKMEIIDLHE